jgi:hypothetical protein
MNRLAAWLVLAIATLFMFGCSVAVYGADPALAKYAVVMVPSHGGSATVIYTAPGRTLLLSAAHMFEGLDRNKPIVFDAPAPVVGAPHKAGTRLLAVDHQHDLALFELSAGPLPYVMPVASLSQITARRVLSIGYDEMKQPAQMRPTVIVTADDGGGFTLTQGRPFHGRSGGALLDEASGCLVGVVSGYSGYCPLDRYGHPDRTRFKEVQSGGHGIYSSHAAICAFLQRNGIAPGGTQVAPYNPLPIAQRGSPLCPT